MGKSIYNWGEIQTLYDSGLTQQQITDLKGTSKRAFSKAVAKGRFKSRSNSEAQILSQTKTPRKVSEETKKKISLGRIKYLEDNPDKVPYLLNHSSKKSYPEKLFETALESSGITDYIYNYQNGIYQYDFAFPKFKLDVEIDGGTHLTEKVQKIDERRDKWSKERGWKVIRFTSTEIKTDIIKCINIVKENLDS